MKISRNSLDTKYKISTKIDSDNTRSKDVFSDGIILAMLMIMKFSEFSCVEYEDCIIITISI